MTSRRHRVQKACPSQTMKAASRARLQNGSRVWDAGNELDSQVDVMELLHEIQRLRSLEKLRVEKGRSCGFEWQALLPSLHNFPPPGYREGEDHSPREDNALAQDRKAPRQTEPHAVAIVRFEKLTQDSCSGLQRRRSLQKTIPPFSVDGAPRAEVPRLSALPEEDHSKERDAVACESA